MKKTKMNEITKLNLVLMLLIGLVVGLCVVNPLGQQNNAVQAAKVSKKVKARYKKCDNAFMYKKGNKKFVTQLDKRITKIYGSDVAYSISCQYNKIVIDIEK